MVTLHYNNTTLDVYEDDNSYRYRALMQKPQLILKFSLPEYIEFPVGTWCEYQNMRFKVFSPQNIKKSGTRNIEYTITFGQDDEYMGLYKLRNSVDKRLKWSMCAKPHEFIEEIVKNLNEKEGTDNWSVGECIEANEQTIEFNHTYIDAALQSVADTFDTEWEIVNKKISLHKVEYFKDAPLPLSYGKGNGFIPGLGRTSQSNEMPIKRLYVQGGEDNIDRSKYGSQYLLLPKSQTLDYDGRTYKTDADGLYIERIDKVSDAVKEDSLDCDEFYPSRVGKVTKVEVPDKDKNFYDLIDTSIPSDLNYNDYIIAGETATLIFQSGMLAGREFEFKYKHAERRFELVPMEEDGQTFPNETFSPSVDDTYAIFGIMLPDSYICDNTAKTGASWDMFREAVKYMYEHEEQKFTFTGTLQGLWTKRNWLRVGGRLKVGGYILFSDTQFAKDGVSIRITGIKDYLSSPYSPTIELSSSVSGSSVASDLKKIDNTEVVIDDTKKDIMQYTKRRFRDAKETISMLNDSLLNFSQSVSPITVQTMAMLVGDESLQFRFVESKSKLSPIEFLITYDNAVKQLHCPHGYLQHMTLGISTISSIHTDSVYKVWEVAEYLSPVLDDDSKKYYLYAKVSRTDTNAKGEFTLSETAIDMDAVDGYYYLLVGILNSAYDDERSYVNLYGFTEILPGRITTDRIVSSEGNSYFDLVGNAMKLGDALDFNSAGDGLLRLKGTIVQSQSGDSNYIGCYRGIYNPNLTYYQGDEVTYKIENCSSTYRYVYPTPASGILPTDTDHWQIIAQGSEGKQGISPAMVYRGEYSASKTYYGNKFRLDCVLCNSTWYIARIDAGEFSGIQPPDSTKWNAFGASFESIATGLLIAELANVAGFIFRNGRLESQTLADGSVTDGANSKTPMVYMNGKTGQVGFAGGKVLFNTDGTVNIGNGKFKIDASGNVVLKDLTMNNITANSGAFKGTLYATNGIVYNVKTITANYQTLTTADAFVVVKYSRKNSSDYCILYMPRNPNNGQIITIKNLDDGGYDVVYLHGNGHKICPGSDTFMDSTYEPYNGGTYIYIKAGRAQQYIFDGSKWQQVGQYEW